MRSKKYSSEPVLLSSVLDELLSKYGLKTRCEENLALHLWYDILKNQEWKNKTKPVKVEDGVLYVKVNSSSLRQRLLFERENLVELINKAAGRDVIRSIIFI